jgi:hypothetical protein
MFLQILLCTREYAIKLIFYCRHDLCGYYDTPGVSESIMEDDVVAETEELSVTN